MLTELWHVPELRPLVPFARLWINRRSRFVWTDQEGNPHDVSQGEGGEQGAALMPALFCLAMRPALADIQGRLHPDDLVVAYLDDVYVLTVPERARGAYDIVTEVLERVCNIQVNRGKLQAWCGSHRPAPPDLAALDLPDRPPVWKADLPPEQSGIKVLGSPIGSARYMEAVGRQAAADEHLCRAQSELHAPHDSSATSPSLCRGA